MANPSLSEIEGEIEGGEGRHTSLNIALRFSSSRNAAICGSMLCWGAISNCNPGDMRSEWSREEGRCQKLGWFVAHSSGRTSGGRLRNTRI